MADIVNGFVSPGYAVSGQLQEILARKKLEKRQALLDAISKQNADTSRMQAESNEKWREAEAKRYEEQANKDWLSGLAKGQELDDTSTERLQKMGMSGSYKEEPYGIGWGVMDDGTDQVPAHGTRRKFLGSPQAQLAEEQNAKLAQLVGTPEWNELSPIQKALAVRQLGITGYDPKDFGELEPKGQAYIFDEATGQVKPSGVQLGSNDKVFTRNRPAASGGAGGSLDDTRIPVSWVEAKGPDGNPIPGKMLALPGRMGIEPYLKDLPAGVNDTGPRAGLADPSNPNGSLVTQASINALRTAEKDIEKAREGLWMWQGDDSLPANVRDGRTRAIATIVANARTTPLVKEMVTDLAAQDPKLLAKLSADDIVARAKVELTEAEKVHLRQLITIVLNKQ